MPKRKSKPSSVNISSVVTTNIGVNDSAFKTLIDLQRLSVENLQTIGNTLIDSLAAERLQALEQLIIAKETDKEEDILRSVDGTLKDILVAIKSAVTPISNTNYSQNNSQTFFSKSSSNTSTALAAQSKEDKTEKQKSEQKQLSILETIAENTKKYDAGRAKYSDGTNIDLGAIATTLAVALGGLIGAIRGQIKAITFFANVLTPAFVKKSIASFLAGLSMTYDLVKAGLSEKLTNFVKIFDPIIDTIKSAFKINADSKIGKVVSSLFEWIGKAIEPLKSAIVGIKDFFTGPGSKTLGTVVGFFDDIGKYIGKFVSVVSKTAGIFGKLFYPFTVVMTLWDTVKGAIEGFQKDGIIGGIAGAIKGFFNSLIFGPVEMLKDAVSWILGVFGFDNAKKALESFDITKIFSDFVDAVFSPVETFKKMLVSIGDMFTGLREFKIPEFSFTIPVIDKKISIGPFEPFKAGQKNAVTGGSENATPVKPVDLVKPVEAGSAGNAAAVSSTSSVITTMKEEKVSQSSNNVIAPTVNTNVKTTQVASIRAPIRSDESSLGRYLSSRAVF